MDAAGRKLLLSLGDVSINYPKIDVVQVLQGFKSKWNELADTLRFVKVLFSVFGLFELAKIQQLSITGNHFSAKDRNICETEKHSNNTTTVTAT